MRPDEQWARVSTWDETRITRLVVAHQRGVAAFLASLGCGGPNIDDLVQETFLTLLGVPFEERSPAATSAFLRRNFLKEICGIDYVHVPDLAPTQAMLDEYKKQGGDWAAYERRFLDLMAKRGIESTIPREVVADGCLLCSEEKPHHCHRRLVADYLKQHWGDADISHLG